MKTVAVLLILQSLARLYQCRSDGAPKSACESLMPQHGMQAQRSSSPYSVNVVRNGEGFRVIISSEVGEEFEGFVLQARSSSRKSRLIDGRFTTKDGITRTNDCSGGRKNTLTQTSPSPKRQVTTEWHPSGPIDENVVFRATVLKTFAIFFTEVDSPPVHAKSSKSAGETGERKSSNHEEMRYSKCQESKGCFGLKQTEQGCIENRDCDILLTYSKGFGGVDFEISGELDPNSYIAFGFSFDTQMGRDAVFQCVRRSSGEIVVGESYNVPSEKYNTIVRQFPRSEFKSSTIDGISSCEFTIKYITETNGLLFDIANKTFYLLLAKGPLRDGALGYHTEKMASNRRVNLTAFESIEGQGISTAIKIHGEAEETDATSNPTEYNSQNITELNNEDVFTEKHKGLSNSSRSVFADVTCLMIFFLLTILRPEL